MFHRVPYGLSMCESLWVCESQFEFESVSVSQCESV